MRLSSPHKTASVAGTTFEPFRLRPHYVFLNQLSIDLSIIYLAFQLSLSSFKLIHKVAYGLIYILIILF